MKEKMVFWLPGDTKIVLHNRLRIILTPVLQHLRQMGIAAEFGAMLSDPLDNYAGCVNIWLATELGEAPPIKGHHILWFLSQMKITPHSVLLAHDAIFTASRDHHRFLQAWVGHLRPISLLGWPISKINRPQAAHKNATLSIDYSGTSQEPGCKRMSQLPVGIQDLANLLGSYKTVKTNLILRERMCGFCSFEEVVAALMGCQIQSEQRQGLVPEIASSFLSHLPISDKDQIVDAAKLEIFRQRHDPQEIANHIVYIANLIIQRDTEKDSVDESSFETGVFSDDATLNEADAFFRDRDIVLKLWHDLLPSLSVNDNKDDLFALPWNNAIGQMVQGEAAPTPWTDLSLSRIVLQKAHEGRYVISEDDAARLNQICNALQRYRPELTTRPLPLQDWPIIPWTRVSQESKDKKRDYLALSRAINGHNIYRFSQVFLDNKILSPIIAKNMTNPDSLISKTAIFMHAYYLDVAQEIIANIHVNLSKCPIFITTDTNEKRVEILDTLHRHNWPKFRVDLVENKGRDVFPKLLHLAPDHFNFEFALHLHTKKSLHSSVLATWGAEMVDVLAGDLDKLGAIAHAFQTDPDLGIVYADPPKALHPAMSWTRNLRLSEILAINLGIKNLPHNTDVDFPVGSMFWARTDALHFVLRHHLGRQHFVQEQGQEDGTLAHAFERIVGVACLARGYHMARISAKIFE